MANSIVVEISEQILNLKQPIAYLATVADNGFPQVRPVSLMHYEKQFYLATDASCRKAKQIDNNNRVEFVTLLPTEKFSGYLRVMGFAERINDHDLKEKVTTSCKYPVKEYWKGVDDPNFYFFEVKPERIEYLKPGNMNANEVTNEYKQ